MNQILQTPETIAFEESVYNAWKTRKLNSIPTIAKEFTISTYKCSKIINKYLSIKK